MGSDQFPGRDGYTRGRALPHRGSEREPGSDGLATCQLSPRRVGSSAAIPALSRLIHHSNEDAKGSAILALAAIGGAELTPTYLDALTDRSWTAKWAALSAIDQSADDRAIGPVIERLRVILGHDRKIQQGGRTDVMCALSYLNRQAANRDAQAAIDWVRSTKLGRLQPDERRWFEATFEA